VRIIDADTHIDETEATWEYIEGSDLQYKPSTAYPSNPDPKLPPARYWVIDGRRQIRFIRSDKDSGTTVETRELLDVNARLKHMDELGTDIQVMYPTLFLMEATDKPGINTAMRRSYNRWLGERCMHSGGRLRWVCMPPLQNMDATVAAALEQEAGSKRSVFVARVDMSYPAGISEDIEQQLKYDARVDSFEPDGEDLIVNVNDTWLHSPPGMRERALGQWYSLWQPAHGSASKIVVRFDGSEVERWTAEKGYQPEREKELKIEN